MLYPNLLNISHYSCLQSSLSVDDIISFALKNNHKYAVIAEINNVYSWLDFRNKAKANNLIPVLGAQIQSGDSKFLILAKNKTGYLNLLKIVSSSTVGHELLDGIILIHLEGEINFSDHGDFYLANSQEPNGVFIREARYLNESDFEFFCTLRSIAEGTALNASIDANHHHRNSHLNGANSLSPDDHRIRNIAKILSSCEDYEIFDFEPKLNFFINAPRELRTLAYKNFEEEFGLDPERLKYKERLEMELKVITDKNFCEYFLIVQDAIDWSRKNGICVGPGRGSVCGSFLAYILRITEIDPIKHNLYFERFLNPGRSTMPDIDVDVANNRRDELLNYLKDTYGEKNVAFITTFQTFKLKNSIREISKVLEVPNEDVAYCLKCIGNENFDLSNEIFLPPPIHSFMLRYPLVRNYALRILNFPRAISIHAAGVIISSEPLTNFFPMVFSHNALGTIQWTASDLKKFNLVKFDFLALNYLAALDRIKVRVEESIGKSIDWREIDEFDPKVYETIIKGKNSFIFQFENKNIKNLIQRFRPNCLLDLALLSAIHRPGASDQIPELIERKFGNKEIESDDFSSFLNDTYGLLIYQEQLMQLVVYATGCSFGDSDTFRRNIINDEEGCKRIFFEKARGKFDEGKLTKWWGYMSKFAKYGFNKSHALAYAVISYRLLWLKTYYPVFFYGDILEFSIGEDHVMEIYESGFKVHHPVYGVSKYEGIVFSDNTFYFPIVKIIGLSIDFKEKLSNLKYLSGTIGEAIGEFISAGVEESDLRILIKMGFFNSLLKVGEHEYFWEKNLGEIYNSKTYLGKDNRPIFEPILVPTIVSQRIQKEYDDLRTLAIGINLNRARIDDDFFKKYPEINPLKSLDTQESGTTIKYVGFLEEFKEGKTFRQTPCIWIKFSDGFHHSPFLAYFGENMDEIKKATRNKLAAVIGVHRKDSMMKIVKIKIFLRN